MKIAIVGGGIGGLALASSLKSMNIDFHLFERAPQFTEVGAGIGLSESTLQILKKIGLYGLAQKNGEFVKKAILAKKDLSIIRTIPIDNDGMCIDRKKLIELLSEKLSPHQYSLNRNLQSFKEEKDKIVLTFSSGEQIQTEWLIACDGINSSIRKALYPQIQKRYSGQTIWRGIANVSLPEKFRDTYFELWGDNLRFGITPMINQRYYWYAVKTAKPNERENPEESAEILTAYFKDYDPVISKVIENSPEIVRDDMWDLKLHRFPWNINNIVFLGDSIHATTPNLAQGGCQAIEDGYTLASLINKYGLKKNTFEKYEKLRRKKTTYIVKKSWQFGQSAHSENPYFIRVNMFVLQHLLPDIFFRKQYESLIDLKYLEEI